MKALAKAVLDAQRIREESYDHESAKTGDKIVDYNKFYSKSLYDSAYEAVENAGLEESTAQPVYLLLRNCWSSIQLWADDVLAD